MDMKDDLPENFDLDDILKEFSDGTVSASSETVPEFDGILAELSEISTEKPQDPAEATIAFTPETASEVPVPEAPVSEEPTQMLPDAAPLDAPTLALPDAAPAAEADTQRMEELPVPDLDPLMEQMPELNLYENAAPSAPESEAVPSLEPDYRTKLRELKRKLIAGPEKIYYELSEIGIGKLQIGIIANLLVLAVCILATTLFAMGRVPENRMKLMVFSQVLAMMLSGLMGCYLMMDGLGDLFRGKFTTNTMLLITFCACLADGYYCIEELRVPCCAAFTLEMTMAMIARMHTRNTEMSQLDTMRKAGHLTSLVREPDYYEGRTAILRGEGDVDDFMETYLRTPGPVKFQRVYLVFALLVCIAIAVFAGMLNSISMGVQIFADALLVAVPASFFVALTRPTALLEKRLHMVGTVICGWQGVKRLCSKAVFPLTDDDLFPKGSTKLNGVKFYSTRSPDTVISYTASLILHAGGGLETVFRNLLRSRNGNLYPVSNFQDYGGGGIGGEVDGMPVLIGSMDFLQDMGVIIPQGTMVSQAVYAAIDGELCAVVAISYAKMRSAAAGLVSLCGCRKIKPLLLAGDFMLTEDFIRSKFNVSSRKVAMPDKATRAELLKRKADPESAVLALTTRPDLVSSAYAVSGANALRTSCRLGIAVHLLGGILGMVIMLALAYLGSNELLIPTNILLYQLIWLIPGWLATEWARVV